MAHAHSVHDSDLHFLIDPITREIFNESGKLTLMQNDHNSERFTFQIPRYIEGHDMMLCDVIEVHYNNIDSSNRSVNPGVYEVDDMEVATDDENVVVLTWLISQNATIYVGTLNFVISFACTEDGSVLYRWVTGIHSTISIGTSINNGDAIESLYPDILAKWRDEIWAINFGYQAALQNGFEGTEAEWLLTLKGEKGDTAIYIGETQPETAPCIWFDTSGDRLANTIFDLEGLDDSTVFITSEGQTYPLANSTVNDIVTSTNQYNFEIE